MEPTLKNVRFVRIEKSAHINVIDEVPDAVMRTIINIVFPARKYIYNDLSSSERFLINIQAIFNNYFTYM